MTREIKWQFISNDVHFKCTSATLSMDIKYIYVAFIDSFYSINLKTINLFSIVFTSKQPARAAYQVANLPKVTDNLH